MLFCDVDYSRKRFAASPRPHAPPDGENESNPSTNELSSRCRIPRYAVFHIMPYSQHMFFGKPRLACNTCRVETFTPADQPPKAVVAKPPKHIVFFTKTANNRLHNRLAFGPLHSSARR